MKNLLKSLTDKNGKTIYIIALIAAGAAFILLGQFFGKAGDEDSRPVIAAESAISRGTAGQARHDVEGELEKRLENILSQIAGAGTVSVMLTLSESAESVLSVITQSDTSKTDERDAQGGTRTAITERESVSAVYVRDAPVIIKEIAPKIAGILIVADGGGDAAVRDALTRAAAAATGVNLHRVIVVKREHK